MVSPNDSFKGNGAPADGHVNGHAGNSGAGGGGVSDGGPASAGDEEDVSLQQVLRTFVEKKWWVLGCFVLVLALATIYTALQPPEYQAGSLVQVKNQSSSPSMTEMLGLQGGRNNVANEVEILRSRAIANRVAEKLMQRQFVPGTQQRLSVLRPRPDSALTRRDVAARLRGGYTEVAPLGPEVDHIRIRAFSTNPKEAALISRLYAQEYAAYDRASSSSRARNSREFLTDVVANFQDTLRQREGEMQTFLQDEQVVAPDAEAEQIFTQLTELRKRRYQAQLQRETSQTQLRELRAQLNEIRPGLAEEVSQNVAGQFNAYAGRIAELQAQLDERYAANPGLRDEAEPDERTAELQQKIEGLRERARESADQLARDALSGSGAGAAGTGSGSGASVPSDRLARAQALSAQIFQNEVALQSADASLRVIDNEIARAQAQLVDIPRNKIMMGRLQRSLQTNSQVLTTLQKRLYDARIAERSELGKVKIIDAAVVPRKPVRPRKLLNLALGSIIGFVIGVGVAFLRDVLDNKVRTPEDLRRRGQNVIGTVPDMRPVIASDFDGKERVDVDGTTYDTSLITLLNPLSPIAESYRRLRTNVQFSRPDGQVQSVLITSAGPGEGKSVTAANLAVAMAQAGQRTLLLDADLRRATGHRMFDVPREPGLVDLVFDPGRAGLDRFATGIENLHVMPAGSAVPNPAEVIGSQKMGALLARAKDEFDKIIVDTPPVLAVTDALLLTGHCDVNMLVCSADQTEWQAIERASETLRSADASAYGVVLNRFDATGNSYGEYGSYGYGLNERYGDPLREEEEAVV